MGQPAMPRGMAPWDEFDSPRGARPGEVKHLSTPRKGKQLRLRELWRAKAHQAKPDGLPSGVAGPGHGTGQARRTDWKVRPQRVKAP